MSSLLFLRHLLTLLIISALPIFHALPGAAATAPNQSAKVIEVGVQPLGYPAAMIGALMGRDAILKRELARRGYSLAFVPFKKGNDMLDLVGGRLDAAFLGDMPTIRLAARTEMRVAGLVKQTFSSIVSRKLKMQRELKGKRIGYAEGSNAHHTLLQALAGLGLTDREVKLVPLEIDAMPDALETGRIDAFAAWEPAPSLALASNPENRVIFRGMSSDYFVLSGDFALRHPEGALHVVAGFVRAIAWMRKSAANVELAAVWAKKDGEALSGTASKLALSTAVEITRREILDVPSAPAILRRHGDKSPLTVEFSFLKSLGKIPPDTDPRRLEAAFDYRGLQKVLGSPRSYRLNEYSYLP